MSRFKKLVNIFRAPTVRPSHFKYNGLPNPQDIRVLCLFPASNPSEPLIGELSVVNLTECPDYDALSYTWEPSFEDEKIADGLLEIPSHQESIRIKGNLIQALRRLRLPDMPRILWVDAIRIDQENTTERNHQVRMMASIYLTASKVFGWLGEESEEKDGQFVMDPDGFREDNAVRDRPLNTSRDPETGSLFALSLLHKFMSRRYFSRRWIIQELYHGTTIEFICGPHRLASHRLFERVRTLVSLRNEMVDVSEDSSSDMSVAPAGVLSSLETLKSTNMISGLHNAIASMCAFRDFECKDARDRIFALSSLWNTGFLTIDYGRPTREVYVSFSLNIIREAMRQRQTAPLAQILLVAAHQAGDPRLGKSSTAFPSWMPDWNLPINHNVSRAMNFAAESPYAYQEEGQYLGNVDEVSMTPDPRKVREVGQTSFLVKVFKLPETPEVIPEKVTRLELEVKLGVYGTVANFNESLRPYPLQMRLRRDSGRDDVSPHPRRPVYLDAAQSSQIRRAILDLKYTCPTLTTGDVLCEMPLSNSRDLAPRKREAMVLRPIKPGRSSFDTGRYCLTGTISLRLVGAKNIPPIRTESVRLV